VRSPSVSAVVAAYNAEAYVGETLTAILSQTHVPDEVIVVDDGSSDGTPDELARFRGEVRIVRQTNRGAAGAYNRAFAEARGEYIARCDADDVWEPDKLGRQVEALRTHPEIDVAVGGAWVFGRTERPFAPSPGDGLLDPRAFARTMYDWNVVCSATAVIRRSVCNAVGLLVERLPCEDYDLWLRALKLDARFYNDPAVLVRYRQHDSNVTNNLLGMYRSTYLAHRWHADLVDDPWLVRRVLARDLTNIARLLVDAGEARDARATYLASLRQRPALRGLAWALALSAPDRYREQVTGALVSLNGVLPTRERAVTP
jgi:glycosyltransferase involved in cell wall biosynthesis